MNHKKTVDIETKGFMSMLLLLAFCVMANTVFADTITINAKKDIVLQGKVLKVLHNGKYKELKRGYFYGYGWLDDHRIFIAFQQKGYSEAIVNAEVIDLRKSKVFELGTIIEADGETNFAVNSNTGEVIFNGSEMDKDGSDRIIGVIKLMAFDSRSNITSIETVISKIDCQNVLWLDDSTIGATLLDQQGTFVTFPVPRQKLSRPETIGVSRPHVRVAFLNRGVSAARQGRIFQRVRIPSQQA